MGVTYSLCNGCYESRKKFGFGDTISVVEVEFVVVKSEQDPLEPLYAHNVSKTEVR
jgi:hypothetical protein